MIGDYKDTFGCQNFNGLAKVSILIRTKNSLLSGFSFVGCPGRTVERPFCSLPSILPTTSPINKH